MSGKKEQLKRSDVKENGLKTRWKGARDRRGRQRKRK